MNKFIMLIIFISSSLVFHLFDLHSQTTDIEDVYEKQDKRMWGDIYSWTFNRHEFKKSYALVIGIGEYKDWPRLETPYSDAIRVRDFLINDDGFDYVVTLVNEKASKQNINRYMEEVFPKLLGENDRFLFYFSGHGTQRIIGKATFGYLVMQHCALESYGNMITMEDIERWDRLIYPTRHVLFILDCCFSGLAGQQLKSPLINKKLERLSLYAHHLITAGAKNEESVGSLSRWSGSLFTDSFIKAATGYADLSSAEYKADGVVSLKELMKYIEDRIAEESIRLKRKSPTSKSIKMSPQISNLQNNIGEFFFITRNMKNEKFGNILDEKLDHGWPIEKKGSIFPYDLSEKEYYDLGIEELNKRNYALAKEYFSRLIEINPSYLGVRLLYSKSDSLLSHEVIEKKLKEYYENEIYSKDWYVAYGLALFLKKHFEYDGKLESDLIEIKKNLNPPVNKSIFLFVIVLCSLLFLIIIHQWGNNKQPRTNALIRFSIIFILFLAINLTALWVVWTNAEGTNLLNKIASCTFLFTFANIVGLILAKIYLRDYIEHLGIIGRLIHNLFFKIEP